MLNLKDLSKKKIRGFLLIEILIAISLLSIIVIAAIQLLFLGSKVQENAKSKGEDMITAENTISYILDEIDSAPYIINPEQYSMGNRNWLGIVFVQENLNSIKHRYNKISYMFKGDQIIRISQKDRVIKGRFRPNYCDGYNVLVNNIEYFNGSFDKDNMHLILKLKVKGDDEVVIHHNLKGVLKYE